MKPTMNRWHRDVQYWIVGADPGGNGLLRVGGVARVAGTVAVAGNATEIGAAAAKLGSGGGSIWPVLRRDGSTGGLAIFTSDGSTETQRVLVGSSVTLASLAGTGTRTVVADANGVLSAP